MQIAEYSPGTPSWVDLGTTSPDDAADFYSALFGWSVAPAAPDSGGYRMALLRQHPVAGIGPLPMPGVPPNWTTYVSVASADGTADLVREAGGTVFMEPMDVFNFGRMAVFADPFGAAFAIWQPGTHIGAGLVNEPGTFVWNELMTTELDGSKEFYRAVFDWSAHDQAGPDMAYTTFRIGDRPVAGMMAKPPSVPAEVPPNWGVYFAVDDVEATKSLTVERGGSILMPGMDIEWGRIASLMDPQGAWFNVIAMTMPQPE